MKLILKGVVLLVLLSFTCCAHAAQYSIKSHYFGRDAFNFTTASEAEWLRTNLLDQSNFGSSGTVADVEFTSLSQSNSFNYPDYSDANIFVAVFGENSSEMITSAQAQGMYNFVQNGGSLIVVTDYTQTAQDNAALVGSYFCNISFGSGPANALTSFSDYSSFPEITNGPFGLVDQFRWRNNATPLIADGGGSTILDSLGIMSAIAPENGSGSVLFFHDPYNFYGGLAYSDEPYDHHELLLNMFSYSAHSVDGGVAVSAVPEPASVGLVLLSVGGLVFRRRRKA